MIRGVLIKGGKLTVTELQGNLQSYYDALDCDLIEIVERSIGGTKYSIVCDEEGLFKEEVTISMLNEETHTPMLVGNLFICKDAGRGKLESLTDSDINTIKMNWRYGVLWGNVIK